MRYSTFPESGATRSMPPSSTQQKKPMSSNDYYNHMTKFEFYKVAKV